MLHAVRLKNFVKFKEDQLLNFEADGVYLFMGENSSGKSGFLEAVRRCLGISLNCTFSTNSVLPNKNAYVVCKFSLTDGSAILTSFVYVEDGGYAQVVVKTGPGDSKDEVCMDLIAKGNNFNPAKNFQCFINEDEKDPLITNLKEAMLSTDKKSIDIFLSYVVTIIKRQNQNLPETAMTYSEEEKDSGSAAQRILKSLSEQVVFTFGLRSIGEVQWSKSPNLRDSEKNYTSAALRCQIINWFEDNKGMYDPSKTKKIFNILTCGETFDFQSKNGKLTVKNGGGHEFSILQVPEGILEAYHISLLLSCNMFQTLLLEEPDKGMHPQMIQRLKSIVLPAETNKIIIIASHNSAFLSPKLIPHTFKFCKSFEKGTNTIKEHRIVKIGEAICKQGEKMPRLIADERYANVLFARRVLLVEGDSDNIFTNALFSHMLNPEKEDSTRRIFDLVLQLNKDLHKTPIVSEDLVNLKDLLTSLYIMKLGGEGEKDRWHAFCENTMTPRLLLLDADAVLTNLNERKLNEYRDMIYTNIVTELENDDKLRGYKVDEIAKCLEKRIFKEEVAKESLDMLPALKWRELDDLYQKMYIREIKELNIASPLKPRELKILPKWASDSFGKKAQEIKTFKDWDQARMLLREHGIFVWKYGSIEDAFLDLILTPDPRDNVLKRSEMFSSFKVDLQIGQFRQKPAKNKKKQKRKLYINEKINDEDINNSIDLVIKYCNKDSDVVHFIHFLTEYAQSEYAPI